MARLRAVGGLLAAVVAMVVMVGLASAVHAADLAVRGGTVAVGLASAAAPEPGDVEVRHDAARVAVKHRGAGSLQVRHAAAIAPWLLPALALLVLPAAALAGAGRGVMRVRGRVARAPPAVAA